MRNAYLLLPALLLFNCENKQNQSDLLSSFEITEGFQIELMAMEPLIADPVDMEIDELGRWYVVEMHGYPLDLSGSGKVKRLLDTDGDGFPDESIVFADSLILPTGIMRWKKGFLVTDPPHVLYLEDTDDDGRADKRDTVLTGFAVSNPQHNVNNPEYGIDNWIYVSHEGAISSKNFDELLGDRGSAVHFPGKPDAPSLPQNANGLFVKFKPEEGQAEMGSARGQFGHTFDPWGHYFLTSNASHLFHVVMEAKYMQRNEHLRIPTGRHYIPKSGKGFEIFPITQNPVHQLLTDVGMMTSACGILWYKGGLFPATYENVIFTAEPTHNLIHADKVNGFGATFESVNFFENKEFLASTDSWFRPVNHYTGPDGALYVIDYYRKIIEHPEWLSDEVIHSGDLYAGVDQGRIYRITPTETAEPDWLDQLNLSKKTSQELIELLNHENSWFRMHAQRLLMDRNDDRLVPLAETAITSQLSPIGKLHAMWILEGKKALSNDVLIEMLKDHSPAIRENAIRIAEEKLEASETLSEALVSMVNDEDPRVRYQLLLSLGSLNTPAAGRARNVLLFQDIEDDWMQLAALSAREPDISSIYDQAIAALATKETNATQLFFRRISGMISRSSQPAEINRFLTEILTADEDTWYLPIVLEGLSGTGRSLKISPSNIRLLESKFQASTNAELRSQSINLLNEMNYFDLPANALLTYARSVIKTAAQDPRFLADALRVIAMSDADPNISEFTTIISNHSHSIVRRAAIDAFNFVDDKNHLNALIDLWPQLQPDQRDRGVRILMNNEEGRRLILSSIESGKMQTASLSWPQTVQLLNSREDDIRFQARAILKGNELGADSIWNQYKGALTVSGNGSNGAEVFKQACGICHQKGGENGIAFGPDLASVQNRSHSSLLLDILQPNRSIADGYELWQLELKNGNSLTGIIAHEGPGTLTLRDVSGKDHTLNRSEVASLNAFETSAMPQNLHVQLSVEEMADLLAYLKTN